MPKHLSALFIALFGIVFSGIALPPCAQSNPRPTEKRASRTDTQARTTATVSRWMLLGPVATTEDHQEPAQRAAFESDAIETDQGESGLHPEEHPQVKIGARTYGWQPATASDGKVDLAEHLGAREFASAYAWAEISSEGGPQLVGVGSDDAVRLWVNGELVHDNWIARPHADNDDLLAVNFQPGRNQLLLKVHNLQRDWAFSLQLLEEADRAKKMVRAAAQGDLDMVKLLLDHGTQVDSLSPLGLTAWQAARVYGYQQISDYLASRGADQTRSMPALDACLDGLIRQSVEEDVPGCAILVSRDGQVVLTKCCGYANIAESIEITPQTKFRIGSVTKQFTAAAILKLCEEGKLRLSDPLSKFLPDFPRGDDVTVHHLLTHTSGIKSYTSKPDFYESVTQPIEPLELINSFREDPFDFEPGQQWSYNNSGYFLLGYVIETVSQMPYGEYLRTAFFQPLGMHDTGVHTKDANLDEEAVGYSYVGGKYASALDWDMSRAGGAGALYSTLFDLQRWNEAVFGGEVLSQESLKKAFTPVTLEDNKQPTNYGYGWMMVPHRGLSTITHGGGLNGYQSVLTRYPEQNLTIVVLSNALPAGKIVGPGPLSQLIAEMLLFAQMKPRETLVKDDSVEPAALAAIVGRYDYGSAIMAINREEDRVFAQLPGQPKFEVFPKSDTEFFWKVVEARVEFVKNEQGRVTKAVHHQGGMTINAPRLKDLPDIKLTPEQLEAYLGKYDYGKSAGELTVTRQGTTLIAQLPGQPPMVILPLAEDEFTWRLVKARVKFVRGEDGQVVKAIHHQAGRKIDASKVE